VKSVFKKVLISALLSSVSVLSVSAQTPERPGLVIYDGAQEGAPYPGATTPPQVGGLVQYQTAPAAVIDPRTTQLVQREYTGQQGAAPTQTDPQGAGDFFFVEEGASGPEDLRQGLSDHNSGMMTQTGSQLSGSYGSINTAGLPIGQIQEAWDRPFDNMSQGQSAPGNIKYQWSSELIMPVRLREGVITNLILPDWEKAEDALIGDGGAIEANIIRGNVVAIRSRRVGVDTSMTVIGGSGNVYTFYLRAEGRNSQVVTDFQVFVQASPSQGSGDWFNDERIMRPAGTSGSENSMEAAPVSKDSITRKRAANHGGEPVPQDRRIFNLKMYEVSQGDRIIAPEYAYTDGRFTYLHFPAGVTDRPIVRRIVDGVEGRVNTRVTGRHSEIIIVEALGDFILRSGTRSVCIIEVDGRGVAADT
jgi:ComB9 competence protein